MLHLAVWAPSVRLRTERRWALRLSLDTLQYQLERITGIPPEAQTLELWPPGTTEDTVASTSAIATSAGLAPDVQIWDVWRAHDGMVLCVRDKRGYTLPNDDDVEKWELSDEQYAARPDTLRSFLQAHQLGRYAPSMAPAETPSLPPDMQPGARCIVDTGDHFERRGTIRFAGSTHFASGLWVGVELDEPVGKNDGSVQGHRYFTTRMRYGTFVRPAHVRVGDFAEEDIDVEV
ncbi:hypothetical protein MEQU1_003205 [Malassezia equina]|uniref:CAP-Gly domain-containing protein n=1 Tax=Malassezia equina TaxID=1381935 RepID=A0AAF0J1I1_9BASI|nr:hypothetical protein MEQU1_003205 [Malassezia equina]